MVVTNSCSTPGISYRATSHRKNCCTYADNNTPYTCDKESTDTALDWFHSRGLKPNSNKSSVDTKCELVDTSLKVYAKLKMLR